MNNTTLPDYLLLLCIRLLLDIQLQLDARLLLGIGLKLLQDIKLLMDVRLLLLPDIRMLLLLLDTKLLLRLDTRLLLLEIRLLQIDLLTSPALLHSTQLSCPTLRQRDLQSFPALLHVNCLRYHGLPLTNCLGCLLYIILPSCPGLHHSTLPNPHHTHPCTCRVSTPSCSTAAT